MARSKAPSKKQQSRGVDFKKIKRKVGRKLPPPKNATNTEIKSKAIILPEQSVASEKAGLAVSKKGLTLKELLQQTSHHNHKVRKDALVGIKELLHNFPAELKLHKLTVIDKLRERISDDDKVVRDTLYQLFKSVILPGCKEDNQGALISLLTAYIFNAMTHLSIDIRLMAFKFFDLIVQHYPTAFSSNAEKVLLNYVDILRTKQFHFHDKGKFKIALSGLMHCLSLLPSNGKEVDVCGKNIVEKPVLHAFEPDEPDDHPGYIPILGKLEELVIVLINCFDEIFPLLHSQKQIDYQSFDCLLSVLQSIDFAVQFLAYRIEKHEMDPYASFPSPVHSDSSVLAQNSFSVLLNKLFRVFPLRLADHLSAADSSRYFSLNLVISKIFFNFSEQICPQPVLPDQFLEFMEYVLIYQRNWSGKALYERNIVSQLTFIPKIVSKVDWIWKHRLLQAFTEAFTGCNPESIVKMACLSAAEEMLVSEELKMTDQQALGYQRAWISELPVLLISLGHSHPSCSEAVLRLLIHIGQLGLSSSDLAEEYDNIQNSLQGFYSIMSKDGDVCYGPFIRLPKELQELSICCLYYLPSLNYNLLASLASCCLCPTMEPLVLHRIVEVMHSAYKAERIRVADHISFFITLLSQYQVIPEKLAKVSSQTTFMSITSVICSLLSQMGDHSVVFQFLEKRVLDLMSLKLPLENTCALMRMFVVVDSRPTLLSEQSIAQLSDVILGYLIDVALLFPEDSGSAINPATLRASHYYILPCLCFFDRCSKLLKLVLDKMSSFAIEFDPVKFFRDAEIAHDHLRRVRAIVSVFSMMCKDVKTRRSLSSCKDEIDHVMEALRSLQMSEGMNISIEHKHVILCALDQLRILSCALPRPAS